MLERVIQAYLKRQCILNYIMYRKARWEGTNGCPDCMLAYKGTVYYVELKSSRGRLSKLQVREMSELQKHGISVSVINSKERVDFLIAHILSMHP